MSDNHTHKLVTPGTLAARVYDVLRDIYLSQGYLYSGCMSPSQVARKLNEESDVVHAALEELRALDLVRIRECDAFNYEFTPHERLRLIELHHLSRIWQRDAWFFYPLAPYGEVGSVRREVREAAEAGLAVAA